MAVARGHLPARFVLTLLLVGLALTARAIDVKAAGDPLAITVHLGYTDVIKAQQWMPVSIAITNNGPGVDGTLVVQSVFGGRPPGLWPASYERPLVLAAGATKHLRSYIIGDPSLTVRVSIVGNGRVVAQQNASTARTASTLIGVLSDDSAALDDFALVHLGSGSATVVHLGLTDFVDSSPALRAFDLLVIDDFATDSLTASQQTAISDFVQTGGSLLIGAGASWRRTLAGLPSGVAPFHVTGLATLASSSALGGLSGVQVATGTLAMGTAWLAEGGQPLLVEAPVGAGTVTMATFDWKQEPISSWPGTQPLLRQVLVRTLFGPHSQQVVPGGAGGAFVGPFGGPIGSQGGSLYQRSATLSPVLGNLPALDLPSLLLTGVLVFVYVLLVGPINYFVLGALHRRTLAWITLPLIAVLAAGAAYGGGIWTKGQSVQTNQVSIIHIEPGSAVGYQETYTGVLTPTRGDYEVVLSSRASLVSPISSYNGFGGNGRADIRVLLDEGKLVLPGMTAFALRGFATEDTVAAPHLFGHLRLVNGQLTGSIQNQSATYLSDAVIIAGDGFQKLGPLAPGTTVSVGVTPKVTSFQNGPPAIYGIYPNEMFGPGPSQPSEVLRDGQAKTQILSLLQGGTFKGVPSATVTPILVGWSSQSFQDLTVNGVPPRAHAQTAVAMPLPLAEVGVGQLPAGVVGGRLVDFDGNTGQGPPGVLIVQDGTVTLQFAPQLAAGVHLTGASLTSSHPMFSKGPPGANTPSATVRGSAWDWSSSTWVDIPYQENAITPLPDEVVNPATGEVLLRVTVNNSSFLPSGISLTGSVQ